MLKSKIYFIVLCVCLALLTTEAQSKTAGISDGNLQAAMEKIVASESDPNLAKLLSEFFSQNPNLRALDKKIRAAKGKVTSAASLDDPVVGVEAMSIPAGNPSLSRYEMSGVQLKVNQTLPFPTKIASEIKRTKTEFRSEQFASLEELWQAVASFKQVYFDYAYTRQAIAIYQKNRNRSETLKNVLQAKYGASEIPLHELLKTKISVSETDSTLIELKNMLKIYQAQLNSWLSRDPESNITVSGSATPTALPTQSKTLIEKASQARAWLKKLDEDVAGAKIKTSLAKQSLLPDFDLSAGYTWREPIPGNVMSGENFVSGGVMVNLPFFWSIPQHAGKIKTAKNELRTAQKIREATENEVGFQVTRFYHEAKLLKQQITLLKNQIVPTSLSAFNSAKNSYEAGEADFLEVITNQNELLMYELQLAKAQFEYEKKIAMLEMAIGETL